MDDSSSPLSDINWKTEQSLDPTTASVMGIVKKVITCQISKVFGA